jgi:hypothetical protein
MFDRHVMCRACGRESVETMARLTRVSFERVEDQCERQCHVDGMRQDAAAHGGDLEYVSANQRGGLGHQRLGQARVQ